MIRSVVAGLMTMPLIRILGQNGRSSAARQPAAGWIVLAAGSVAVGVVAMQIRPVEAAVIYAIALAAILTAAAVDAVVQRLPNVLTLGSGVFALLGLTAISTVTGAGSPGRALAGGAIFGGWILLGALVVRDGYGLGDVKLAAACGILAGWSSWTALTAAILASQVAITLVLIQAKARGRQRAALGPAFVAGLLIAITMS